MHGEINRPAAQLGEQCGHAPVQPGRAFRTAEHDKTVRRRGQRAGWRHGITGRAGHSDPLRSEMTGGFRGIDADQIRNASQRRLASPGTAFASWITTRRPSSRPAKHGARTRSRPSRSLLRCAHGGECGGPRRQRGRFLRMRVSGLAGTGEPTAGQESVPCALRYRGQTGFETDLAADEETFAPELLPVGG